MTCYLYTEMVGPHRIFDMLDIFLSPPPSLYISDDWSLILQTFVSFKMDGILWDKQIWNNYLVALGIKLHWNYRKCGWKELHKQVMSDIKMLRKVMLCGLKKCKINRGYSNHGSDINWQGPTMFNQYSRTSTMIPLRVDHINGESLGS